MSYFELGAATPEWGWDQYQARAVLEAGRTTGNFVVVQVYRNGSMSVGVPYPTRAAMLTAWDKLGTLAPDVGFAVAFDKTVPADQQVVEQKVNPLIESLVVSRTDWRNIAPWALGSIAVIAAAVYMSKAHARRRSR